MKEIEKPIRVEQHEERQQEQQYKLMGKLTHKPGLTLFEYDPQARTLVKAEIVREKTAELVTLDKPKVRIDEKTGKPLENTIARVKFKPGCHYFEALNYRNAVKKVAKMTNQ